MWPVFTRILPAGLLGQMALQKHLGNAGLVIADLTTLSTPGSLVISIAALMSLQF